MRMGFYFLPFKNAKANRTRGQVVVEYVLLLIVAVIIVGALIAGLVSRDGEPGLLVKAWQSILTAIGSDTTDEAK